MSLSPSATRNEADLRKTCDELASMFDRMTPESLTHIERIIVAEALRAYNSKLQSAVQALERCGQCGGLHLPGAPCVVGDDDRVVASSTRAPDFEPAMREALLGTASLLESFASQQRQGPGDGYTQPRTICCEVWDNCDAGGQSVDSFQFDDGEADALAKLIRAALSPVSATKATDASPGCICQGGNTQPYCNYCTPPSDATDSLTRGECK